MQKKRQSKSWYVKIKSPTDEREVRVTGVTTPEAAMALVVPEPGEEVVSARPVRAFKSQQAPEAPAEASNDNTSCAPCADTTTDTSCDTGVCE